MTVKERLYALMTYYGKTKTEFAEHIGTTLQILNVYYSRSSLSKNLRAKILTQFPEVSPEWLETGDGVMLIGKPTERVDASLLISDQVERVPMFIQGLQCDSYIKVSGFTFEPTICNGDIIGVRQQDIDTIDPAKPYLIVTEDGTPMIKRIVATDADNIYISTGETQIKPFPLVKAKVKGLYRIVYVGRII